MCQALCCTLGIELKKRVQKFLPSRGIYSSWGRLVGRKCVIHVMTKNKARLGHRVPQAWKGERIMFSTGWSRKAFLIRWHRAKTWMKRGVMFADIWEMAFQAKGWAKSIPVVFDKQPRRGKMVLGVGSKNGRKWYHRRVRAKLCRILNVC